MAELAGRQHGVVSTAQLGAAGLSKDAIYGRVLAGRLHRLRRGVYAVGHVALTPRARELAAVLGCGPGAVLSHRSAAALWGLVRSAPRIEVTAARTRKARSDLVVHRSRRLDSADRATVDGVPVTSVARTLVDLADVVSERVLADAVHESEVRRLFDLAAVRRVLERVSGRAGERRLQRVLAAYDGGLPPVRSEAERRFLALCDRHGLPAPASNVPIGGYEVDFLWRSAGLAVEVDGVAFHHTRRAFQVDRQRDRELAALGIHVVRVTWRDVTKDATALAGQLATILARSPGASATSAAPGWREAA